MNQDSFAILEKLSESATTAVYKAHQNVLDRVVLLKVLHKHLLRDKNLVARFTREARACAILRSVNIVQVYDLTEVDGAPAIVMEYVEGKSLEEKLLDGMHSEELAVKVADSVLNALSYAHERGVIHRDIKPANILVSEDGTFKVTDFGLAAVSDAPSLTMEGSLVGTPAYMSPEQARGDAVDGRADLFSLGVTLIEVLTGERILLGASYAECINKIQNFQLESLEGFAEKCSPQILNFLRRLLAPDRNARFSSADEALKFISSFLEEEKGDAPAERNVAGKKRSTVFVGGIGIVSVLVVALVFALGKFSRDGMPPAKGTVPDTSSRLTSMRQDHHLSEQMKEDSPPSKPAHGQIALADKKAVATQQGAHSPATFQETNSRNQPGVAEQSRRMRDVTSPADNDPGYVSVVCKPWADVYVDSDFVGRTPIAGAIKIPPGKHTVLFANTFFEPIRKEINVQPRLLSTVEADFLKNAGYIFVTVDPWAEVYVDENLRDTTPLTKPIEVSPGIRKVRLHNKGFHDIEQSVKVKPGDTLRLNFSFLRDEKK